MTAVGRADMGRDARQRHEGAAAQGAPQFLGHQHHLDRALLAATRVGREGQAQQAQPGHAGPAALRLLGGLGVAAVFGGVLTVAEALHRFAQRQVVVVQREVHVVSLGIQP